MRINQENVAAALLCNLMTSMNTIPNSNLYRNCMLNAFLLKIQWFVFFRISSKEERQVNREQRRRRRQREGQKSNRFKLAKQQLCKNITLSWYISLPSLYDYHVKMPNFTFCGKREHKTTTLFFLFPHFDTLFRIQLQNKLPTLNELNEMEV